MAVYHVATTGSNTSPYDTWAKAMATANDLEAFLEGGTPAPGDIFYIKEGTYTEAGSAWDMSAEDATAVAPITFIGVKSGTTNEGTNIVYSDWSDGNLSGAADDRPLIAMGAYAFLAGDYYKFYNITFSTTEAGGIASGAYNVFYNCKFTQSSDTANRIGINMAGSGCSCICCEGCGTGTAATSVGRPFRSSGTNGYYLFCYAHDCNYGYTSNGGAVIAMFCIAEDCVYHGFSCDDRAGSLIFNCSANDCNTGIYGTTAKGVFINNAIKSGGSVTEGIQMTTQQDINFYWKNAGHEDADDIDDMWVLVSTTHPHGDLEWLNEDVKFTADGNLSLQSDSGCIDNGLAITLGVA